ncbi:MAG: hypothetical protein ACJAR8_002053 [Bacteroidia bacterium]|jgi:hypothetical protein
MNKISLLLISLITIYSCKDDDSITPESFSGPFEFIEAGNSENAYSQIVNDTFMVIGQVNTQNIIAVEEYDLDNNGTNDIQLSYSGGGGDVAWAMSTAFYPLDSNKIIVKECSDLKGNDSLSVLSLEADESISKKSNFKRNKDFWNGFTATFRGYQDDINCWGDSDFKYIGVEIKTKNSIAYSWVKLKIIVNNQDTQIIVESFGSRE